MTVCNSVFDFRLKPLFAPVDMSKFKDGRVHQKIRGERVNVVVTFTRQLSGCEEHDNTK